MRSAWLAVGTALLGGCAGSVSVDGIAEFGTVGSAVWVVDYVDSNTTTYALQISSETGWCDKYRAAVSGAAEAEDARDAAMSAASSSEEQCEAERSYASALRDAWGPLQPPGSKGIELLPDAIPGGTSRSVEEGSYTPDAVSDHPYTGYVVYVGHGLWYYNADAWAQQDCADWDGGTPRLSEDYDPGQSWNIVEGELVLSALDEAGVEGTIEDGRFDSATDEGGTLSLSATFGRCEVDHQR